MFVQFISGRVTDAEAVRSRFDEWMKTLQPDADGWQATTAGVGDDQTFFAAVVFESEEAARANSNRAEQGEWWRDTESLIQSPEFADGADAREYLGGVDDAAGFVQVIRGSVLDADLAERITAQMEDIVGEARPDVTGMVAATHGGRFTQVVYFTDEASAREGERSDTGGPDMDEFTRAFGDLSYIDIRDPWNYAR